MENKSVHFCTIRFVLSRGRACYMTRTTRRCRIILSEITEMGNFIIKLWLFDCVITISQSNDRNLMRYYITAFYTCHRSLSVETCFFTCVMLIGYNRDPCGRLKLWKIVVCPWAGAVEYWQNIYQNDLRDKIRKSTRALLINTSGKYSEKSCNESVKNWQNRKAF